MDQSEIIKSAEGGFPMMGPLHGFSMLYDPLAPENWKVFVDSVDQIARDNPGDHIHLEAYIPEALASTHEVPVGEWSHEPPKVEGYYWFRYQMQGEWKLNRPQWFVPSEKPFISSEIQWWSIPIPVPNTDGAVGLQEQEK